MSTATAAPRNESRPAPPGGGRPGGPSRRSMFAQLGAGLAATAVLVVGTIALWPDTEADKARADGERLGEAVGQLYAADSSAEAQDALAEVRDAAADSADHAGDAVAEHVAAQEDALARAVDGYVGATTTSDDFEAEVYEAELDAAAGDLDAQAAEFRDNAPEVEEAFWEGFDDGLPGD